MREDDATPKFQELSDEDKKFNLELMKSYSDTAKIFTQLAVAALVLPVVFARQILAIDPRQSLTPDAPPLLILIWIFFLLAIGLGLLYQ